MYVVHKYINQFNSVLPMAFGPLLVAGVTLKDLSLTGVDARLVLALPPPLLLPENEDRYYLNTTCFQL